MLDPPVAIHRRAGFLVHWRARRRSKPADEAQLGFDNHAGLRGDRVFWYHLWPWLLRRTSVPRMLPAQGALLQSNSKSAAVPTTVAVSIAAIAAAGDEVPAA